MSIVCTYAVLRFRPYLDTGEFANLGIVLLSSQGDFCFRLETTKINRITNFFPELDKKYFIKNKWDIKLELESFSKAISGYKKDLKVQMQAFDHLVAPKEGTMVFSQPSNLVAKNAQEACDELFMRYVHHKTLSKDDPESALKRSVAKMLKKLVPERNYVEDKVGPSDYKVSFPFVWKEKDFSQVIKPLSLNLDEKKSIMDKGDKWMMQIKRLETFGKLPADTVFLLDPPRDNKLIGAYKVVFEELEALDSVRVFSNDLTNNDFREDLMEISF